MSASVLPDPQAVLAYVTESKAAWTLGVARRIILQEAGNCHLYEKMGYRRTGEEHIVNESMTIVSYEKVLNA